MAKRSKFQIRSDAAKQRWHVRDDKKEGFWRGHIAAWRQSGLSKRGDCMENDLAYSSFMTWLREEEAVPLLEKFHTWLQQQYTIAQPKSSFAKALFYCLNNWKELTQYVKDGELKIDKDLSAYCTS